MFNSLKYFLNQKIAVAIFFTLPYTLLAQNSAQAIINDMTLPCDAKANGCRP